MPTSAEQARTPAPRCQQQRRAAGSRPVRRAVRTARRSCPPRPGPAARCGRPGGCPPTGSRSADQVAAPSPRSRAAERATQRRTSSSRSSSSSARGPLIGNEIGCHSIADGVRAQLGAVPPAALQLGAEIRRRSSSRSLGPRRWRPADRPARCAAGGTRRWSGSAAASSRRPGCARSRRRDTYGSMTWIFCSGVTMSSCRPSLVEQLEARTGSIRPSRGRRPRRSPRTGTTASGSRPTRGRTGTRARPRGSCTRASPSARRTCRRSRCSARARGRPRATARRRRRRTSCARR